MMKYYTTLLLATLVHCASHAQITIGQAEMPDAGNQIARVKAAANPLLNFSATGPAHTWNFSNLSATGSDNTAYQTVASTNFVYAIAYANLPFNPNRANQAKPGVDIPFSNLLPIANPYTFRYRSSSVYKTVGFGAEVSGIPLPIAFSQHDVIYNLPLHYGDSTSSHSAYSINIPSVGSYAFQQDRTNQVDGWGAITTPAGTFDVLRVKTTLNASDNLMGININRPVTREYKWLAQGLRTPVLQINTTSVFGAEVVSAVWYYDVPRSINVVQPLASVLCPGAGLSVHYEVTGAFNAGGIIIPANQFRAQLSDATGSFANPVNIGSVQATGAGVIAATIPANTPVGTGYRIRVMSTSPAFTGTSNTFNIAVGGVPNAAISAAGPVQICTGNSVTLTAVGGPGYQWQLNGGPIAGATDETYAAAAAGTYTATVTNACGSATSNSISVEMNEPPVYTVDAADLISCANAPATIAAQAATSQDGLLFQWYLNEAPIAGANSSSVTAGLTGQYTMEVTNPATGCTFLTEGVMATVESVPAPAFTASSDSMACAGGQALLAVVEEPGMGYQWSLDGALLPGATGTSLAATQGGVYGVTASNAHGCISGPALRTLTLIAAPAMPTPEAHGPTSFCMGGEVMLSVTEDAITYQWFKDGEPIVGATANAIVATTGGDYTLVVTNSAGCSSVASAPITIATQAAPPVSAITPNGPLSFCAGGDVNLTADDAGNVSFQWWFNGAPIADATDMTFTATTSGSYTVVLHSPLGCSTIGATVAVLVNPLPGQPVIVQHGDSLVTSGPGSFQWFLAGAPINGATASWWIPAANGNYTVQVTDANGCTNTSSAWPFLTSGIGMTGMAGLRAYPNPGQGLFTLELPGARALPFDVVDITGQLVVAGTVQAERTQVDLGQVAEGIYFVRFPNSGLPVIRMVVAR